MVLPMDNSLTPKRFVIVVFDMCSSSNLIEDLTLSGNISELRNFFIVMKEWLVKKTKALGFSLYKFTGDGWILLFPEEVEGRQLYFFLKDLCRFYRSKFAERIAGLLETNPGPMGLTFGITFGELIKIRMVNTDEFIGRALNVACRLQGAVNVKEKESNAAYKALLSSAVYNRYFKNIKDINAVRSRRILHNIREGKEIQCIKIALLSDDPPMIEASPSAGGGFQSSATPIKPLALPEKNEKAAPIPR